MSFVERAMWPDMLAAVRAAQAGKPVGFPQAMQRYLAVDAPTALDACCGVGQGAAILRAKGYHITAFDKFPDAGAMLAEIGAEFTCCDFYAFEPGRTFDLVTCCDALEHIPRPVDALARLASWTAPHGRLYLTVPLEGTSTPNPYHCNAFTRETFRDAVHAAGLRKLGEEVPHNSGYGWWGYLVHA